MIGFLYPLLGLAVLAAAVPLALHLIRRRDVRRVSFPAVRYLRRAEQRHAHRLRLRHLLLLAVRVLVIFLLAIAAAGPLVGRGGAADHRPTALAIIIDDSQSSARIRSERRLLDHFAERASLALDQMAGTDRVALFSAVRPDRAAVSEVAAARDYLRDLQPIAGRADLGAAFRQASAWLASAADGRAREIHLLTDMQRVSLSSARPLEEPNGNDRDVSVVVYAPELEPLPNGTPGAPLPAVLPLSAGQHTTISVPLHWFGQEPPADPTVVRLVKAEEVIAAAEGRFGGLALLRLPPQDAGWVQGYVEIDGHGLAIDDRRYFSWFVRPPPRVAVLGDPGAFVLRGLEALEDGGRLSLTSPDEAEVWVAGDGERVEDGLGAGRAVVVVPPIDALDLPRLNSRLIRARIPWRYEAEESGRGATRIAGDATVAGLGGLEVRRVYRLRSAGLASADTATLRLEGGEPWLIRGTTTPGAAYLLLASPMTMEASDLPVSAGMVPFLDVLLGDWARRGAIARAWYDASTPVRLPTRAREIVHPDGSRTRVEGGAWLQVTRPGNYTVMDGEDVRLAFSVNAPVAEADLAPARDDELEAILPTATWSWSRGQDPAEWRDVIFRARRGKLAWRPLVVLLIVVSIVEASLAAARPRRDHGGGPIPTDRSARV